MTIEIAREFWKEFDLNKSEGSGMKITENGIVTHQYGSETAIYGHKLMGESITHYKRAKAKK